MSALITDRLHRVVVLGAHCDDIAIGAGATLLQLCRANPGVRVLAVVLTGAGTVREAEERAALAACCPGAELEVRIGDLPDGALPAHWAEVRDRVRAAADTCPDADLVLTPQSADAHQDHRLLAEMTGHAFRNHLVWGYEIAKYESDLPAVNCYVEAPARIVDEKVALLQRHYPSQHGRDWFDAESFTALLRLRGVQSKYAHAEAFMITKQRVRFTGGGDD
ncbi:MAG: PIG-L family deacetylase [Propionibacteriales bacterium]|nr:PIG-L family deacetylase [Propionibacteriales bacterium]